MATRGGSSLTINICTICVPANLVGPRLNDWNPTAKQLAKWAAERAERVAYVTEGFCPMCSVPLDEKPWQWGCPNENPKHPVYVSHCPCCNQSFESPRPHESGGWDVPMGISCPEGITSWPYCGHSWMKAPRTSPVEALGNPQGVITRL